MNILRAGFIGLLLLIPVAVVAAGKGVIRAAQIVENPDTSRTFVHPLVSLSAGREVHQYGIRRGVPGACRLVGMHDFLSDYVQWSRELAETVAIDPDGSVRDILTGYYIESMTCIPDPAPLPVITAKSLQRNSDGSVTVEMPVLHHGPNNFPIHSGHVGACRLLGFSKAVKYSLKWSEQRVNSVSLAADGNIYSKATGVYLTAMDCKMI